MKSVVTQLNNFAVNIERNSIVNIDSSNSEI